MWFTEVVERGQAGRARPAPELAEEALLPFGAEPVREARSPPSRLSCSTQSACVPDAVDVEVLVRLEGEVVPRILDLEHRDVAFAVPYQFWVQLCAPVQRVAGHEDQVGRARRADRRDGRVRRAHPLLGGHVVRLVHEAEDHPRVALERRSRGGPEVGEVGVGHRRRADQRVP